MGYVCSTRVEIYFVSYMAWDRFAQHNLRYILCPRGHGKHLVNPLLDTFRVFASMGWVSSTDGGLHFASSVSFEGCG